MNSVSVKSFAGFVNYVENNVSENELVLFRGQPKRGDLLPKVARADPSKDTTETERQALQELKRMGASFFSETSVNDWELLVQAQHYGLATRLLDWTSNPLAALWFACSSNLPGDTFVYTLDADELMTPSNSKKGPFDVAKTRVYQPKLNNPRISAQHGWFTAHRYSQGARRFVALENNTDAKNYLTEIVIAEDKKDELLKSLDRHGINYRTLFPDLEGLCRYLSWRLLPS